MTFTRFQENERNQGLIYSYVVRGHIWDPAFLSQLFNVKGQYFV